MRIADGRAEGRGSNPPLRALKAKRSFCVYGAFGAKTASSNTKSLKPIRLFCARASREMALTDSTRGASGLCASCGSFISCASSTEPRAVSSRSQKWPHKCRISVSVTARMQRRSWWRGGGRARRSAHMRSES